MKINKGKTCRDCTHMKIPLNTMLKFKNGPFTNKFLNGVFYFKEAKCRCIKGHIANHDSGEPKWIKTFVVSDKPYLTFSYAEQCLDGDFE